MKIVKSGREVSAPFKVEPRPVIPWMQTLAERFVEHAYNHPQMMCGEHLASAFPTEDMYATPDHALCCCLMGRQ